MRIIGKLKNIISILIFLISGILFAESIRGPITDEVVVLAEVDYSKQIALLPGKMVPIKLDNSAALIDGLEIEVIVPEQARPYCDCFAVELFYDIKPVPDKSLTVYSGERALFQVFPFVSKILVKIPINKIKDDDYSSSPGVFSLKYPFIKENFPVLFVIQPILKGIPDLVLKKEFTVRIKPVLQKNGYLSLKINKPQELQDKAINLMIDDKKYDYTGALFLLDTGIHSLKVDVTDYKPFSSSFVIDTGKTNELTVLLERIAPLISIESMPGVVIFIDGIRVETGAEKALTLSEGQHSFRFKIGDYNLSKNIYIENGKNYNISLFFDIEIKEN